MSFEEYLKSTEVIDCDAPEIVNTANQIVKGKNGEVEQARALFYFVRDEIKYRLALFQEMEKRKFKASYTLKRGYGFCISKALLLIALSRAIKIPARFHLSDIRNFRIPPKLKDFIGTDILAFHGYADLYLSKRWIKVNPAFDLETCRENRFVPVDFTGDKDALSHAYDFMGNKHIEYVMDRGSFADFPYDLLLSGLKEYYGLLDKKKMAEWNRGYY